MRGKRDTARNAQPMFGDALYQTRARAALPLLVRQAEAGATICYSDLAAELGMLNPRNLNAVLGSIGQTVEYLVAQGHERIPPIQCLVVNKHTGLPGEGIGWFLSTKEQFASLPTRRRREIIGSKLQEIYTYRRWREILAALNLQPAESDFTCLVNAARALGGTEESDAHKVLKRFVANNPTIVGAPRGTIGEIEKSLSSGDCLDVSFAKRHVWIAAEVKSSISTEADIARGIFQCVKYLAVMEAMQIAAYKPPNARAVLILEGKLTPPLIKLKNTLAVEVIDSVTPDAGNWS